MKRMKKPLVILCVLLTAVVLAACSGTSKHTTIRWASFEMPDGYVQVDGLVDDVLISTSEDTDPLHYKLDEKTIQLSPKIRQTGYPDAESMAIALSGASSDQDANVEAVEIGERTWYVSTFSFMDEQDSVMGFTDVTDDRCVCFTAYYMGLDDPDLQTVLETLEVNESKLP